MGNIIARDMKHSEKGVQTSSIQKGPSTRGRKNQKKYIRYVKESNADGCDFCCFDSSSSQVVEEYARFWKIKNIFEYDVWDGCRVTEHLMISPKRHVISLADFDADEKSEYFDLIAAAESDGYNIYARSHDGVTKSVDHQHTHLLRIEHRRIRYLLYSFVPHILWFR